jgi:hypothetical protein
MRTKGYGFLFILVISMLSLSIIVSALDSQCENCDDENENDSSMVMTVYYDADGLHYNDDTNILRIYPKYSTLDEKLSFCNVSYEEYNKIKNHDGVIWPGGTSLVYHLDSGGRCSLDAVFVDNQRSLDIFIMLLVGIGLGLFFASMIWIMSNVGGI